MKLGDNILKLRKQKGLSQEQLGEQVNVTRQTISNWELGETAPNPEQLKLLSKTLNVSIDALLDNKEEKLIDKQIDNKEKSMLEEKTSNTEKLAGIIIKILKVIGILFIVFVIIDVIAFIMFVAIRKEPRINNTESVELSCSLNNNKYTISISEDNFFRCDGCNNEMIDILGNLTNTKSMEDSIQNIENYFSKNGGICE